jgi:hypothetical protein
MAYNTKKGSQHSGDIQYEGDPNDTQIDFENDSIGLKTGGTTRVVITNTGMSGSGTFNTIGSITSSANLAASGSLILGEDRYIGTPSLQELMKIGDGNIQVNGLFKGITGISGSGPFIAMGASILGSTLAVSGASAMQAISGSGILQVAAAITSSGDIVGSGSVHATNFYGDGSTLTGVGAMDSIGLRGSSGVTQTITNGNTIFIEAGAGITTTGGATDKVTIESSGTTAQLTTGVETSGYLKVSGSSTFAGNISGSGTLYTAGAATFSSTMAATGSVTAVGLYSTELISGSLGMHVDAPVTFGGPVSTTGSISGSSTLQAVDNVVFGSTLSVSGAISSSLGIHVTGAQPSLAIGDKFSGEASAGMLSIRPSDTSNKTLALMQGAEADGNRIALGVSGSGMVLVGGVHMDAMLNVSGSDLEKLFSAKSDTKNPAFYISGSGDAYLSGKLGIGTNDPLVNLDVNGNSIRVRTANTPSSAGDLGAQGEIRWDADYIYICVATDTWKRVAISTW